MHRPARRVQLLREFVAHVSVRDAIVGADDGGSEVPVGRGEVPWDELLFLLQETDYRGWLTVDRTQGSDQAGDAARAVQYMQSILHARDERPARNQRMDEHEILSVTELTQQLKALVETGFPQVYVEGEISNVSRATSGHIYLTLKDETAQIRAVLWRSAAARIRFELHDGLHVVAVGPIEVYAARGTYQLVIERLAPQGIGPLELAFRQRYEKLAAEGVFRAERKRPLPRFPRRIALVTSPMGAAVRDMLQVITRRWPACDVVILPVAVQGAAAAAEIAAALRSVHRLPGVDVVIAGRGGGSLEDLWAFNEEIVARAIFECPIPVVERKWCGT